MPVPGEEATSLVSHSPEMMEGYKSGAMRHHEMGKCQEQDSSLKSLETVQVKETATEGNLVTV